MENHLKDKRVIFAAALLALISLILLGSALKDVSFRPAQRISQSESETIQISFDVLIDRIVEVPVWKQFVLWILLLIFVLLVSALLSPEMRKRLLLSFLQLTLSILLFLYIMKKNPDLLQGLFALGGLGTNPADSSLLDNIPPPVFEPPHISAWLSFFISFGIVLLAVVMVWRVNLWWIRRKELLASRRPLEEIAEIARTSLQQLSLGSISSHNAIIQCYERMSRTLDAKRGLQRDLAMTPSEFSNRLENAGLPREPVHRLTHLFEAVRYGLRTSNQQDVEEAVSCLTSILKYCGEPR